MAERPPISKLVVLATGGTGGHVFPAEALAGELEARGVPFALVTDSRGRQWQGALARRPIHYIHSASPSGSLAKRLQALLLLGLGLFDAWRALGRLSPAAVVGFGGYASVPTMIAARLRRMPAMVHEQNAVLGRANRLVLGGVSKVATSFARTRFVDDRAYLVGNPVREPVRALRGSTYRAPGPDRVIDLLAFGGSQGAASFSQVIPEAILSLPQAMRARLRIVQQCRPEDLEKVRARYEKANIVAELAPFFADLPQRLAGAHLVIGRSGASTVAELATIGRPSILVPYPYAADDHQTANARAFEAAGACIVIPHAEFTAPALAGHLRALFEAPERMSVMAAAARAAGRPDAASRLADLVIGVAA
ncbi:MAG: undecaprenyldiphospho-muramoylpentapeptide beta-N-acetylglucosaminyltransferase [Reyranella sp.]|uniref:undecaprenyldiphospho-muramoylpentapeptide beta-N-acetylglucosaminyltransferase n=1 Tax=Reyranella sp. TaxID=1929291 RepID=UPI001AC9EEE5|nr:undecaprenyldiphospho-muramoylpentapeptide beta-N-acetylglucosaminyltransferase [Reyranella sp.]MBN9088163.1 undecaprenyldiphospho-muramoylpentapeptide beta-N-acetylglucosaminyltransferase [Reyranella sp.]